MSSLSSSPPPPPSSSLKQSSLTGEFNISPTSSATPELPTLSNFNTKSNLSSENSCLNNANAAFASTNLTSNFLIQ